MMAGGTGDVEDRGMERENPWRWEFELWNFRWAGERKEYVELTLV